MKQISASDLLKSNLGFLCLHSIENEGGTAVISGSGSSLVGSHRNQDLARASRSVHSRLLGVCMKELSKVRQEIGAE